MMTGLLDYTAGDSLLHRLNPVTKLVLSFGLCASCFLSGNILLILGIIVLNLLASALSGIAGRSLRILRSLAKLSALLFVVQIFFVREGRVLLRFPADIYITDTGLLFSLLFVCRLIAATMPLTLMLSVTRMSDLSNALNRYFRIPYKYTFVLTTAIRFVPLFADEMAAIIDAQVARGLDFDTRNVFKKLRLLIPLCVPLLISSVRRIEGGAISAELRGFNFRGPDSGYKRYPPGPGDAAAFLALALVIAASVLIP
ncbi:MAG: energy-coupling factor transporter transmembrane protein EcfT [Treponema sp.]|jgi:energy-coupling factor transport system permease protein|nr:energy-coupling factor transporter transmembrane protein EcfT [Treponema sp.]